MPESKMHFKQFFKEKLYFFLETSGVFSKKTSGFRPVSKHTSHPKHTCLETEKLKKAF